LLFNKDFFNQDVGGNVKEDQVYQAFRILTSDKQVNQLIFSMIDLLMFLFIG
jgi:hypothetical protein